MSAPFIVIIQFEIFIKIHDKNPEEEAKKFVLRFLGDVTQRCILVALHFDLNMKHETWK